MCHLDDLRSVHAEFHEFSMHRSADMNISLLYFFQFFTLEEQELGRQRWPGAMWSLGVAHA
jgi:hypothetical protein